MRVTGGTFGGRRLRAAAPGTRPTSDRVRVALFARLGDLTGARVLDLYAGTGALGIEALSRGAREVVFIERAAQSLAVLRGNIASLELGAAARILTRRRDPRRPSDSDARRSASISRCSIRPMPPERSGARWRRWWLRASSCREPWWWWRADAGILCRASRASPRSTSAAMETP